MPRNRNTSAAQPDFIAGITETLKDLEAFYGVNSRNKQLTLSKVLLAGNAATSAVLQIGSLDTESAHQAGEFNGERHTLTIVQPNWLSHASLVAESSEATAYRQVTGKSRRSLSVVSSSLATGTHRLIAEPAGEDFRLQKTVGDEFANPPYFHRKSESTQTIFLSGPEAALQALNARVIAFEEAIDKNLDNV